MSEQKKSITLYRNSSLENRLEQSPDPESGQAIWARRIFTLTSTLNPRSEKQVTVPFRALKRDARPFQFQLARPLARKCQKQLLPATQNPTLGGN